MVMAEKKIKVRLLAAIAVLLFGGLAFGYDFYGTNFNYRKDITIESDLIDADLSFFPVLVKLVSTKIDFSHFLQDNGNDIRFTDSIGGSGDANGNILDFEIERFNKAGEVAEIWVEIRDIYSASDTTFYMFYGNNGCGSGEDVDGTWDGGTDVSPANNFVGIWHLKEVGDEIGNDYQDSTGYLNHGQGGGGDSNCVPTRVGGKIGYGQEFDGDAVNGDFIDIPSPGGGGDELDITGSLTLEAWMQMQDARAPTWGSSVIGRGSQYKLFQDWDADYRVTFYVETTTQGYPSSNGNSPNTWYYMVGRYNGSTSKIYRYETEVDSDPVSSPITSDIHNVKIGLDPDNDPYDGLIDEVRISDVARSPAWIKASYHSGNDSLLTIPTLVGLSYFRAKGLDSAVLLEWATETELDNAGFNLLRSEEKDGEYMRINPYFIPARGSGGMGAEYSFTDYDVINGKIYCYKLEDIDIYGKSTFHGPVSATPNDIIPIWPEISTNPPFPASETLSFPEEGWESGNSLWLRPYEWEMVLRKAQSSGGQLFWRVRAKSTDGREIFSEWRRFLIEGPKVTEE